MVDGGMENKIKTHINVYARELHTKVNKSNQIKSSKIYIYVYTQLLLKGFKITKACHY